MFPSRWCLPFGLLAALAGLSPQPSPGQSKSPDMTAEQIRAALEKKVNVDYVGQSLAEVFRHLRDKTGVRFTLDNTAATGGIVVMPGGGVGGFGGIGGIGGGFPGGGVLLGQQNVQLTIKNTSLRQGLQSFLRRYDYHYAVVRDRVVVGSGPQVLARQMQQTVDMKFDTVPLSKALKKIAAETGVQILIDPKALEQAEFPVQVDLNQMAVADAVRLTAFLAGMKSVRVSNVLVVTTPERAGQLPAEEPLPQVYGPLEQEEDGGAGGPVPGGPGQPVPAGIPTPTPPAPPAPPPPPPAIDQAPGLLPELSPVELLD